jgi:Cu-processing system permease protein
MDRHATRILKYETHNLVRTRWLPAMGILLFAATEVLFRFGGDPAKVVTSLMNVALVILPLVCLVVGTVYFYNAREFNELLLAQPMNRASLYLGKLISFTAAISAAYLMGLGLPFLIHNYQLSLYAGKIATLLAVGLALIVIFSAMAFWVATRYEEKIKGLGYVILLWFFLAVVYDGIILLFIHTFREYPYETPLLILVMANPIDLGRILILLQMDISALLGYTGAVFRKLFGTELGVGIPAAALLLYAVVPIVLGLRAFRRKDL